MRRKLSLIHAYAPKTDFTIVLWHLANNLSLSFNLDLPALNQETSTLPTSFITLHTAGPIRPEVEEHGGVEEGPGGGGGVHEGGQVDTVK